MLGLAVAFVVAFFWAPLLPAVQVGVGVLAVLTVADGLLLWGTRGGVEADHLHRHGRRLSRERRLRLRHALRLRVRNALRFDGCGVAV